eukprot:6465846-Amphidinium_carterae.2
MERTLGIQHEAEMSYLENQAFMYYQRRWQSLKQEAQLEYSRARTLTLEDVSRFESTLVNRFTQAEQLAYQTGRNDGFTQSTMLRMELAHVLTLDATEAGVMLSLSMLRKQWFLECFFAFQTPLLSGLPVKAGTPLSFRNWPLSCSSSRSQW